MTARTEVDRREDSGLVGLLLNPGRQPWSAPPRISTVTALRAPRQLLANMCSPVTSQGSAITRFDRAVRLGVPQLVLAAAHELPKPVLLRDALRVVLVLAAAGAEEFPLAAARFGARMVSERRMALVEAQLMLASLSALASGHRAAGGEALCVLLERHGEREAARYLEEWLAAHSD